MGDFWTYTVKLFAVYNKHGVAVLKPEENISFKHSQLVVI